MEWGRDRGRQVKGKGRWKEGKGERTREEEKREKKGRTEMGKSEVREGSKGLLMGMTKRNRGRKKNEREGNGSEK